MQLVVQSGAEPGRVYELTGHKMIIGRQSGNEVVVPDEQVSRRHAQVEDKSGALVISDLDSSNGTYVNGTRISSAQSLQPGDTLQVGTTVLKVVEPQPKAAALSATQSFAPTVRLGQEAANAPSPAYVPPDAPAVPADQPAFGQPYQAQPANTFAQPAPGIESNANGSHNPQGQPGFGAVSQENRPPGQGPQPGFSGTQPPQNYNYGPPPGYQMQQQQKQPKPPRPAGQQGLIIGNTTIPLLAVVGVGLAILALIAVLVFLLLTGSGGGFVGEIPAPKNNTRLEFATKDLEQITLSATGKKPDLTNVKAGAFTSKDSIESVYAFYNDELKKKGWTDSGRSSAPRDGLANLQFRKGDQVAEITLITLKSSSEINAYSTLIPSFKDKLKQGETLVMLSQLPQNVVSG